MKHLKTLIAAALLLITIKTVNAQDHFDVFQGTYTTAPGTAHENSDDETDISEMSVNVKIPSKNKAGDVEVFGIMASSILLDKENEEDLECYSIGVNYSYILKDGDNSYQLTFVPKLNYDLDNGSRDILQLGGVALATIAKNDKLKYKYGLYYNRECFGHFFVPLVGFDWRPNENWQVYGTLPMNATAAYKFNEKLTTGFNFTGIITSFRLKNDMYMHKTSNELYGFADFYLAKNILLQTRVGYSLGRNYKLYEADDKMDLGISALKFGDDRRQLNDDVKDGMVLQAGLIYRVNTNKK